MALKPDLRSVQRPGTPAESTLASLSVSFGAALATPNVALARAIVAGAAEAGAAPGRLYLEVIRPALARLVHEGPAPRVHLAADVAATVLAEVLETRPRSSDTASGRVAVVAHGSEGMHAVDGHAATEFLEWGGWCVERLRPGPTDPALTDLARGGAVELAVLVVGGRGNVGGLAPICIELRRASDPPVIVLADFGGRARPRATLMALGADDAVVDPDALLRSAAARSPEPGRRRWGVRLHRSGATLTVAPTGCLDATSVDRLADVATTRAGSFERLIVDLRDLSGIEPSGVRALTAWPADVECGAAQRELLVDTAVRAALHQVGVAGWQLSEPGVR